MAYRKMVPGDLFVVPLFAGGYAYGCVTYVTDRGYGFLCDVYDLKGNEPEPPSDIEQVPLLIRDMWIGKAHFFRERGDPFRKMKWRQLQGRKVAPRLPGRRYAWENKNEHFVRIDTHRRELPIRISSEEQRDLPRAGAFSPTPYATSWIETRLLRLQADWLRYADDWLARNEPEAQRHPTDRATGAESRVVRAVRPRRGKYAPCHLIDGERSTLSMPIPASTIATFEAHERQGSGYDWTEVVRVLIRKHEPGLGRQLRYDPEADTFSVSSKSKPALAKVAKLIRKAIAHEKVLAEAIAKAEID